MGFSIKLAPGVRIRASSRGVRTSLGPRVARVHIGGGRTGMSTGLGPVNLYTSVGGARRTGGNRGAGSAQAAYQRQLEAQRRPAVQAEKAAMVQHIADAFLRILNLHRVEFPPAQRPLAPEPAVPDRAAIQAHYEQQALAGIGKFRRAERAAARQQATGWAEAEFARQWQHLKSQQAQWQQHLDAQWQLLCGNDADTVLATLAAAFEDNEAPAAAVGMDGGAVSLVLLVPLAAQAIPDQLPGLTAAGNPSLRKISPTDRADYYKSFVFGQILVTLRPCRRPQVSGRLGPPSYERGISRRRLKASATASARSATPSLA